MPLLVWIDKYCLKIKPVVVNLAHGLIEDGAISCISDDTILCNICKKYSMVDAMSCVQSTKYFQLHTRLMIKSSEPGERKVAS